MRIAMLLFCVARLLPAQGTGAIEGSVTTTAGTPLAGARVSISSSGLKEAAIHRATTDAAGNYRVTSLEPGNYAGKFEADDFMPVGSMVVRVGAGTVRLDMKLAPVSTIRGQVLDDEGRPAADVPVELYPYRAGRPATSKTDRDGRFVVAAAPRVYALLARPAATPVEQTILAPTWFPSFTERAQAERIIASARAELSGYQIRLRRVPVFRVQGTVADEQGKPVAGAAVRLDPNDVWQPTSAEVRSGADGVFEFPAVRAGEWRLRASVRSVQDPREGFGSVTVEKHDVERVAIRVYAPFAFSGFVDREDPRDGEGKRKVSGVYLTPVGGEGNQELAFHEQDGKIQFKKVQPGRYVIFPVGYMPGYYVESVKLGDREVMSKPIELTNGAIPFRIAYKPNAGRVRGNVEKGEGSTVVLLPQDEALLDGQFIRSATCDANGHFEVGSLKPGEYYAFAFDRVDHDALEDVTFVRNLRSAAVLVHVEAGQAADAVLKITKWPE